jgi:DNA repair protein RecO (recombination protein O)
MDERARGLVLRLYPLTETSLIVHWLTAEFGRMATVAKGARRPKSPFRGKLDLFYLAEVSFNRSRRSELHTLREVNLLDSRDALRRDIAALRQASYCGALIQQVTESQTPIGSMFELMEGVLKMLPQRSARPETLLAFELRTLELLGLQPDLAESRLSPGSRQVAKAFLTHSWENIATLRASRGQIDELNHFLHGFLIYHLGKIPRGRAAAIGGKSTEGD